MIWQKKAVLYGVVRTLVALLLMTLCVLSSSCREASEPSDTSESSETQACVHDYRMVSTTATCTERGVTTSECVLCGHVKEKYSNSLGHDFVDYHCMREGCGYINIYYAADYGAVGDGVTDDGPAICEAVGAATAMGGKLFFESGKTYYVGTTIHNAAPFASPFTLQGTTGMIIEGEGATFRLAPDLTYLDMRNCTDVIIRNCYFDYAESVYLVGTVTKVEGKTITYATDIEPYTDFYDYSGVTAFSVKARGGVQNYAHGFIKTMTKTGDKEVTVVYTSGVGNYRLGDAVYLPNPGIGHVGSEALFFSGNKGTVVLENIEIRAARNFVFHINGNEAEINLNNVDLIADQDSTRSLKMVSWRDGFHCKDNRGAIHWTDCENGVLFDDVMNIRNTPGYVKSVSGDDTLTMLNYAKWVENTEMSIGCEVGDILDFYDQDHDVYYGYATVKAVTRTGTYTTIELAEEDRTVDLAAIKLGSCLVGNRNSCAPGSTITGCTFSGSLRLQRGVTAENTVFNLLSLWILAEGGVEGPIPGDLTFKNCTFRYGYIQVDGYNRWDTGQYMPNIGAQIRDIRLYDCTITDGCYFRTKTGGKLDIYVNGVLQED